jgi:DNA polymerase III alpha subunit
MDVDIDLRTDFDPLKYFPEAVRASRVQSGELKPHAAGVYFQSISKDKITGLAAIPYEQAEELGYFKIDFLHLSFLDNFESKEEVRALLKKEPNWVLLQSSEAVSKLFQLHNHFELVSQVKPQSVQELADCIALIRPGKRYLLKPYLKDRNAIRNELYTAPEDGRAWFKKPHAVAYALTTVLQLHLIEAKIL